MSCARGPSRPVEAIEGPLTNRSRDAVLLAYHSIHPRGPRYLSVTPDAFERQLVALARDGYGPGRLDDLERLRPNRCPAPLTFLTFDGGYRDNYEIPWACMREHGFTGVIFLVPSSIDTGKVELPGMRSFVARRPDAVTPMSWRMVEELSEAGMQFGSHTLTHPRLPKLTDDELAQELLESARLGCGDAMPSAYPFGDWDSRTAAAAAAGYRFAFALPPMSHAKVSAMTIPHIPVKALKEAGARWVKGFTKADGGKRIRVARLVGHNAR
jgi:peptidoglycan/xylan/chitin deacetylase (PgdA/CDA1 family)